MLLFHSTCTNISLIRKKLKPFWEINCELFMTAVSNIMKRASMKGLKARNDFLIFYYMIE